MSVSKIVKTSLSLISGVGVGIIANQIQKSGVIKTSGSIQQFAVTVAVLAVSGAVAKLAEEYIVDLVDSIPVLSDN